MYASDYGQCLRKQWYQFFPEDYVPEVPITPRVARIFQTGDDVHERLSEYLRREAGLNFKDEVDVPRDDLDVHGRCDGIATLDSQSLVIEFKSMKQSTIRFPKDEHVGQITWYMTMWRLLRAKLKEDFAFKVTDMISEKDLVGVTSLSGRTVDDLDDVERWLMFGQGEIRGEIIYESKVNSHTYHFPVDYDEDRAQKVRLWFEQLDWHVKKKIKPNVLYDQTKFPCSWGTGSSAGKCPFYDICWGGDDGEEGQEEREEDEVQDVPEAGKPSSPEVRG